MLCEIATQSGCFLGRICHILTFSKGTRRLVCRALPTPTPIMFQTIIANAIAGKGCSPEEARFLLEVDEAELLAGTQRIREAHFGNEIQLCAIINAKSGKCDMDCTFCSQAKNSKTEIEQYPLMPPSVLSDEIRNITQTGDCRCSLVTSGGKLSGADVDVLVKTVGEMNFTEGGKKSPMCASLGRLNARDLASLKEVGVTRLHHNLESSKEYYPEICTTQTWDQRLKTVKLAQEAGMEICSGGLFGLGESWDDRISLALTLRELGVDSVPINFLYSHEGTPLCHQNRMSAEEALRIVAVYRCLLPKAILRICGGRSHVLGERQYDIFAAGANGLMTGNYLTVAGSQYEADLAKIEELGLKLLTY